MSNQNHQASNHRGNHNGNHRSRQSRVLQAIEEIMAQRRIPRATYRLQFNAGFTFEDARSLVTYLDDLGISDIYASPIFLPRMGSTHGYDVADPTRLNSDLGSEDDFDALTRTLQRRNIGLVLDIVPNHMGVNDPRNQWWLDVLENGPSSEYAEFFDIQWHPMKAEMANKVLLPILGDQYGVVLERGELRLYYDTGSFYLTYYETTLPLAPRSYTHILRLALELMAEQNGIMKAETDPLLPNDVVVAAAPLDPAQMEIESILTALSYLPARSEDDPTRLAERNREKEIVKRRLVSLHQESEAFRTALEQAIVQINGQPGKPESFDLLDQLVDEQVYRLSFWRVAGEEINYRRFFDINELAAIRVELPHVFAATHALALRLLTEGKANGLRIDHPDGLYDPVAYFYRLQEFYLYAKIRASSDLDFEQEGVDEEVRATIQQWLGAQGQRPKHAEWPLYVVAEKILSENEPLPLDWAVQGTTGYDFLTAANGILVDTRNERAFSRLYNRISGTRTTLHEMTFGTKMMIMRDSLAGEITTLAQELEAIGEGNRHYRDFTFGGVRTALREVIAALKVYRTYIDAHQAAARYEAGEPEAALAFAPERDRKFVAAAVREAKRRHPLLDDTLFDFIEQTLLLQNMGKFGPAERERLARWVMKFQQLTGPVMAKGVEDTAFYRYYRLASLNEVGDHPAQFGTTVEKFHEANRLRAELWPHAMLATSTHDNKRSEDVRARMDVLSEMPDRWQAMLRTWSRLNASKKLELEGESTPIQAPDDNDEYLFYQTLLGVWPLHGAMPAEADEARPWGALVEPGESAIYQEFRQRIAAYMLKAAKEAKIYTSWLNPGEEYEKAVSRFVERALQPSPRNRFLKEFAPFAASVAYFGQFNSLAQTLLKLTSPGVPDIYQGNELWDFSLVDPDNRRPVDYARRAALLKEVRAAERRKGSGRVRFARELMEQWPDGRSKLHVTQRTLTFRRDHEMLFTYGSYVPLDVVGERAQHVCAYLRQDEAGDQVIVVVPRLVATLVERELHPPVGEEVWGDTAILLPADHARPSYTNLFTGERVTVLPHGKSEALHLDDVLANFPVALLAPQVE